ncbi:MAG: peptidylprolyl isomerase [Fimbriimonadaceae bacterium]
MISALLTLALNQSQELIPVNFDQVTIMPKTGEEVGVLETGKGKIVFMFFPQVAPKHVSQVKMLLKNGTYTGTRFHRCISNFMIQGGDPKSKNLKLSNEWGTGGFDDKSRNEINIKAEFSELKHLRGVLSMARSGDPDSASSQFFIVQKAYPSLDGEYTAFGKVVTGLSIVDKIALTGPKNLQLNGTVEPSKAVVVKKAYLAKWPVK